MRALAQLEGRSSQGAGVAGGLRRLASMTADRVGDPAFNSDLYVEAFFCSPGPVRRSALNTRWAAAENRLRAAGFRARHPAGG